MSAFPDPETHKDTKGDVAPLDLIGRKFKHVGRGKTYEVLGFCWIGDTDEWGVLHSCEGDPVYCRSLRNFLGIAIKGNHPRFEEVT